VLFFRFISSNSLNTFTTSSFIGYRYFILFRVIFQIYKQQQFNTFTPSSFIGYRYFILFRVIFQIYKQQQSNTFTPSSFPGRKFYSADWIVSWCFSVQAWMFRINSSNTPKYTPQKSSTCHIELYQGHITSNSNRCAIVACYVVIKHKLRNLTTVW
jgi:hypothetical protein